MDLIRSRNVVDVDDATKADFSKAFKKVVERRLAYRSVVFRLKIAI